MTLVERLAERAEIGAGKPLLVVGAGVAGAAAAIRAARLGVPTHLVDRAPLPFGLQRRALSRFIDPCVYDWPVDHCMSGLTPPGSAGAVLKLKAAMASELASTWHDDLMSAIDDAGGCIDYRPGTGVQPTEVLQDPKTGEQWIQVTAGPGEPLQVSAIIWAAAEKVEKTTAMDAGTPPKPIFEGIWFWAADDLVKLGKDDRVLISGAGDGALQDYIRATTGMDDMSEILRILRIPDPTLRRLHSAEDRAHRGRVWMPDVTDPDDRNQRDRLKVHEERWIKPLEAVHRAAAKRLLLDPTVANGIAAILASRRRGRPKVHLLHRSPYLTAYYGLNRFLTLLLAEYLMAPPRHEQTLFAGASIRSVDDAEIPPGPPLWSGSPDPGGYRARFKREHRVAFHGKGLATNLYNVIIVRHGHDHGVAPDIDRFLRSRKQLLPFFSPP